MVCGRRSGRWEGVWFVMLGGEVGRGWLLGDGGGGCDGTLGRRGVWGVGGKRLWGRVVVV